MSNYERDIEINEGDEYSNKSIENQIDAYHRNTKNIPVKTHIRKIEEFINDLKKDLNENKKNGQILRSENISLEHKNKERCNQLTKSLMEDLNNFEKEFKRVIQNDKNETDFLKKQVNSLILDKTNLDQSRISLETKLKMCEDDVGIEFHQ